MNLKILLKIGIFIDFASLQCLVVCIAHRSLVLTQVRFVDIDHCSQRQLFHRIFFINSSFIGRVRKSFIKNLFGHIIFLLVKVSFTMSDISIIGLPFAFLPVIRPSIAIV